ncbi:MAG: 23S rRNA (adenine(2503)-C(2))-methyltransferase RlmN [Oscillospiraceae bacterium]|nr:23S rRNA (adenine(2503)-C(2))-methyltransferase RlmN [Oscillospiraceae bacterium]
MNLLDYTLDELKDLFKKEGIPPYRADQVLKGVYLGHNIHEISNLPISLRELLNKKFEHIIPEVIESLKSKDDTEKFLLKIEDGNIIETALMKYSYGNTICISSQIGCRMGCKFCASCINGLIRNLTPGEMIGEILSVKNYTKEDIKRIVIMGSGEPLDNFSNVLKFLNIINREYSFNISQRNITLSTCGIVPKIYELADENLSINLAISLHAASDEIRIKIMKIACLYKINDIIDAAKYYFNKTKRRITFEYALINSVNDSKEDAYKLSKLLKGINCHVNLIPVNKVTNVNFEKPSRNRIDDFMNILIKERINTTKRRELGEDIDASCGQLKNSYFAKF